MKIKESDPWHSAIAVLEDNIFASQLGRWGSHLAALKTNLPETPTAGPPDSNAERRREARFSLSLPVHHKLEGGLGRWVEGRSLDVSQNGIRLELDAQIPVGTQIHLKIKLPNSKEPFHLRGIVVWEKPSRNSNRSSECGIAFQNLRTLTRKERIIHFLADQLCKYALMQTQEMSCRPAVSKEDLIQAYHLTYREYLVRGYCRKNPAELHYYYYCMLPDTRTFLLEKEGKLAGTITLIPDSPCGLPMETLFPDEIKRFRKPCQRLAEVSLLALDQRIFGRRSFSLTDLKKLSASFRLFKIMFDYARTAAVTDLIIGMHPKHQDLYRYLTFESFSPARSYRGAEGNPALPMHMNIHQSILSTPPDMSIRKYFVDEKTPSSVFEKYHGWTPEIAREFLIHYRPMFECLEPHQQAYLRHLYPDL